MKKFYWIITAILTCGSFALTACVDNNDTPVNEPVEESIEYLTDPSTRWTQREELTFIAQSLLQL